MDDFQKRALESLRQRHTNRVRQDAEEVREYAGYLLNDLERGGNPGHYARSIASDAQEMVARLAALEALGDAAGILETNDEPAKEAGQ